MNELFREEKLKKNVIVMFVKIILVIAIVAFASSFNVKMETFGWVFLAISMYGAASGIYVLSNAAGNYLIGTIVYFILLLLVGFLGGYLNKSKDKTLELIIFFVCFAIFFVIPIVYDIYSIVRLIIIKVKGQ